MMARDADHGITVIVTTGVWDGQPADLDRRTTVVHALVANMGSQPVLLAPGNIQLVSDSGFRYRLLDAGAQFHVNGNQSKSYDVGRWPDFRSIRSSYGDVASSALPWGELQPGTQMRGFLYFERIESSANHAQLTWHMESPAHESLVNLKFDLHVARPRA